MTDALIQKSPTVDGGAINIKNKLNDLSQKLVNIITDYQVLLEMLISYFKNLSELDKTIENASRQYENARLPLDISDVETIIREHGASKQAILEMFKFAKNECDQIIHRIRKQVSINSLTTVNRFLYSFLIYFYINKNIFLFDLLTICYILKEPPKAADHDIDRMLYVLNNERDLWEISWNKYNDLLEQHRQFCQFDFDLHQINENLDDLSRQLSGVKGQYGESLSSAKSTSLAFAYFEKTIEVKKISLYNKNRTYFLNLILKHYLHQEYLHKTFRSFISVIT